MDVLACLLVGLPATLATMVIHGFMVHVIVAAMSRDLRLGRAGSRLRANLTFVTGTTVTMLVALLLEVALWALVLELCGGIGDFGTALYASAGNYTTVGSGSVVLPAAWRLLGPIEAAAGMLMFGVSTGVIVGVIQRLLHARLDGSA